MRTLGNYYGNIYLSDTAKTIDLAKDQILFSEGDEGQVMFVVISGSLKVFINRDNKEIIMNIMKPGHFFGEMSLLENEPRSASVCALEPTKLMVLKNSTFEKSMRDNTTIATKIMKGLSHRLRAKNEIISILSKQLKKYDDTPIIDFLSDEDKRIAHNMTGATDATNETIRSFEVKDRDGVYYISIFPTFETNKESTLYYFHTIINVLLGVKPLKVVFDFGKSDRLQEETCDFFVKAIEYIIDAGGKVDIVASSEIKTNNYCIQYIRGKIKQS